MIRAGWRWPWGAWVTSRCYEDTSRRTEQVQQAIDLQKEAGLQGDRANGLNMLADVLMAKGEMEKARASYEESLKLATEQDAPSAIASSRAELASLEIEQGHAAQAETLSSQAADEFAAEKLVDNEADARNTLARVLLQEGKASDARAEVDRGLALRHGTERFTWNWK